MSKFKAILRLNIFILDIYFNVKRILMCETLSRMLHCTGLPTLDPWLLLLFYLTRDVK